MQYGLGILEHDMEGQKIMAEFNVLLYHYQLRPNFGNNRLVFPHFLYYF